MPKPYPQEFRDDVVRVARNRQPGVTLEAITADIGIHAMTLWGLIKKADIGDGIRPGITSVESAQLPEAKKRIRLLDQENEVRRRAAAYVGSMGQVGSAGDNAGMESFFALVQKNVLNRRHSWPTRDGSASRSSPGSNAPTTTAYARRASAD